MRRFVHVDDVPTGRVEAQFKRSLLGAIAAVQVAHKTYQMNLVQAKRFVDELASGSDDRGQS